MSLFDNNLFDDRASDGLFGLGELPQHAAGIASYSAYPRRFPGLPSAETLRSKGVTHFTADQAGAGSLRFTFMDEGGNTIQQQTVHPVEAAQPDLTKEGSPVPSARREGDGLLPGSSVPAQTGAPKWLPYALIGGGLLVAGGIVWAASATPKRRVAANRRRRRRRTSR